MANMSIQGTIKSCISRYTKYHLPFIILLLLALAFTGCGSNIAEQPPDDEPADFCPDTIVEFGNLEVEDTANELTFAFDVPPI